jgi:N-acetylglutamate synthase-like GNAT family acetyltransferase
MIERSQFFMAITIREAQAHEIEALIPILLQAEASEGALRWSLANLSDTVYRLDEDGNLVGAATLRWNKEPVEIIELAIIENRHGQGFGRQMIDYLINQAQQRGKRELFVGTANTSIGNFLFYQKCGFRMDHIRKDYFWYHQPPDYENGLQVRDLLVFRYELAE